MFYEKQLTIPKNTARSAPVETTIEIHPGIALGGEVFFPPGCAALAHVQVYYWEHQVAPVNPDGYFSGDGPPATPFNLDLEIVDPPYLFTVVGWNEDDTYPHTPIVRINVIPFDKDLRTLLSGLQATGARGAPIEIPEGL
jgi:hypothetical protein